MPVETMTLSRLFHLNNLKAGLPALDTVLPSDGGPNTPGSVPLTEEHCQSIRVPQKTHPAEPHSAMRPPLTTVSTSHTAPIPQPSCSSSSLQPGSTQSAEEVSSSSNQTIQGHSSDPGKELPGNKPKKAFFFMPVSLHNWSVEDYMKRFQYVANQLMGAVSNNSKLRCRSQHIIYKSVMIGVSEDMAVPCVLVLCRKTEYKDLLKLIGDLDTGLIGCYMDSNSIFSRSFRSQPLSNDPPFELIIEAHTRGPLQRRAGEMATISLTSETFCGASVRYQDRIATISLVLSIDGIYRLVTVDHLFNSELDSEELNESTDTETSSVDSPIQGLPVDQRGGKDENLDSEMTQTGAISKNPATASLDHTPAPHSKEASSVLALHGGIATQVVKPPFALHPSAPYLDWTVLEFVWNPVLSPLNMIYLNDSKSPTVLRNVAKSPKSHGTPVYMISGTGKLKEGNLLTGVTYLGPRGECDPCEVWTMLLEPSKGLMPGESGSLVVDRETFAVYGYVVGTDILDNVYIVPLTQTIRQIESTFHASTVCLPDLTQSSKRAASSPAQTSVKNRKIERSEVSGLIQGANKSANMNEEFDSSDPDVSVSDDNGANGTGRGSGNDQDERRKTVALSTKSDLQFACPFVKRYPGEKQPRCHRGWCDVRRVKEHLYRVHKKPIHCERCFQTFASEKLLDGHLRQNDACSIVNPPPEILGIDAVTKMRLKTRKGVQNLGEEEKWKSIYTILFPDVEGIPSPYFEPTVETALTAEAQAQYRSFLRSEVPLRAIRDISNTLRNTPGFQFNSPLSEREFFEMISASVWNAFDAVPDNVMAGDIAQETTDRFLDQLSPTVSSVPQPTGMSNLVQASDTANDTNTQEWGYSLNAPMSPLDATLSSRVDNDQIHDPFGPSCGSEDFSYITVHDFSGDYLLQENFSQAPAFGESPPS